MPQKPFFSFQYHAELDSTNDEALRQIRSGKAVHGLAILAVHQTKGRGQRGSSWAADEGQNLTMSLILRPEKIEISAQFALNMATALSVHALLAEELGERLRIKWPNDIYFENKKIGGLLIENGIQGNYLSYAILGVGLNVNQLDFSADLPNPTSLKKITGIEWDVQQLAQQFCTKMAFYLEKIEKGNSESIRHAFNKRLFRLEQPTLFRSNGFEWEGRVLEVTSQGLLVVQDGLGRIQRFAFKEIEWIL